MLKQAGEFARANKLLLHTHLDKDEGFDELIQSLFSTAHDYFDVFESTQCIADKTVFAHGTLLSLHEMKRMGDYAGQVGISHCPSSNFSFAMGMAPVSFLKTWGLRLDWAQTVVEGTVFLFLMKCVQRFLLIKHYGGLIKRRL
ncbi:amidohydrolase family protein [Legionella pneumophila]|nr:amidohydrolase family protein [Legionella pneumophila]